jgi:WD40 repeat protein
VLNNNICNFKDQRKYRNLDIVDSDTGIVTSRSVISSDILNVSGISRKHVAIIGSANDTVGTLDLTSGETHNYRVFGPLPDANAYIGAVAGSPDGKLLFAGMNGIEGYLKTSQIPSAKVLSASNGGTIASFPENIEPITQAVWDPRGRYVAFTTGLPEIILWTPQKRVDAYLVIPIPSYANGIAVNSTGNKIAIATDFGIKIVTLQDKVAIGIPNDKLK